jgi:hypothetical protein
VPDRSTAMEEEAPAAAERGRQLPWRGTVAVQAALCLALYAAFSLGEPQLFPRCGGGNGVDALGRGARGGGVAFLSVAGGSRAPAEQARLLRQVRAVLLPLQDPVPWRVVWALCVLRGRVASALWRIGIAALHCFVLRCAAFFLSR